MNNLVKKILLQVKILILFIYDFSLYHIFVKKTLYPVRGLTKTYIISLSKKKNLYNFFTKFLVLIVIL